MKTKLMIKKKSSVRTYSRKVNNKKKVKYSRKLLRGGAVGAPIPVAPFSPAGYFSPNSSANVVNSNGWTTVRRRQQQSNPQKQILLKDLYECSKIEDSKTKLTNFEIYECTYKKKNNYEVDHVSYLYVKKPVKTNEETLGVGKVEEEVLEVFNVYGPSNQGISIEYNKNKKFKDIGKFYDIKPLELSVDTMQFAVNTGKLNVSTDEAGNSYLGFVDFPSLVVTERFSGSGFSYSGRNNATWIPVYEQDFEDTDKVFDLIETMDGRHIEKATFDNEINSIVVKIDKLKQKFKNSVEFTTLDKKEKSQLISKLHELKPKFKTGNELTSTKSMSNESLFIKKQEEMRALLSKEISIDEKLKEKQKIEEQVKYRAYVRLEGEDSTIEPNIISENIDWVLKNSLWLEKYLELKNAKMIEEYKKNKGLLNINNDKSFNDWKKSINVFDEKYNIGLPNVNPLNSKDYDCDLSGLDEKYIIVDEFINSSDGETYVICGYPNKEMKEHILNFWKLNVKLNNNLTEYIADLFDKCKKNDIDKIDYKKTNGQKLYNLYSRLRNIIEDYEMNRFKELEFKNNTEQYEIFKQQYLNNYNSFYQAIALKYFTKPMVFIKYVFLVFQKKTDGKLIPMVFNMKEIKQIHQPVLERVDKLIKKELSYKFGILDDNEYNNKSLLFDDEYKLWFSIFNIGNMFHISTEYVHTMSNISRRAHHYLNIKTLEEIIYSCVLLSQKGNNFFKDIKFNYKIRDYKITNYQNKKKLQINNTKETLPNRTEHIFALYEEDKLLKQFYKEIILTDPTQVYEQIKFNEWKINNYNVKQFNEWKINKAKNKAKNTKEKEENYKKEKIIRLTQEDISKIIFILMFKSSTQEYTFIYLLNDNHYKLVIKSNMVKLVEKIIMQLQIRNEHANTITFTDINPLFSIASNDLLDITFVSSNIFRYNPLVYYKNTAFFNGPIKQNPNNYFENSMIKDTTKISNYGYSLKSRDLTNSTVKNNNKTNTLLLINIYNQIPILAQNFLLNDYYIRMVALYDQKLKDLECNTLIKYDEKIQGCGKKLNCMPQESINCVHINLENCGYNFIETIDNSANKIVVYILPYGMKINKEDKENYTNNFDDYKDTDESKVINPYLSNNRDLDNRCIPMLNELKKLYVNNHKILCFVHQTSNAIFMCLHFHIIPEDEYKRSFPKEEIGIYISQTIDINTLINNITSNPDYYKNSNFSLLRQQ